ncbi:MAG: hypothetical protein AB7O62_00705 [Pirellulales bacterium]
MHAQLLGYLLGALEPDEHEAVELALSRDEQARHQLQLLRRGLEPLRFDADDYDPPAGLALKTCQKVRQHREQAAEKPTLAPVGESPVGRSSWSLADMAMAAGIVIAASLLFMPAISHSRQQARMAFCQDNLRRLGLAFDKYALQHAGFLPRIPTQGRLAFPGMYGPYLKQAGFLDDDRTMLCPCCKLCDEPDFAVPTEEQLLAATKEEYQRMRRFAGGSFGYNVGYTENGQYQPVRHQGRANLALLSDSPDPEQTDRCGSRHGRHGQNVLYDDGHVEYLAAPLIPGAAGDNLFLNADGKVAPGIHANDSVIVPPAEMLNLPLLQAEDEF